MYLVYAVRLFNSKHAPKQSHFPSTPHPSFTRNFKENETKQMRKNIYAVQEKKYVFKLKYEILEKYTAASPAYIVNGVGPK